MFDGSYRARDLSQMKPEVGMPLLVLMTAAAAAAAAAAAVLVVLREAATARCICRRGDLGSAYFTFLRLQWDFMAFLRPSVADQMLGWREECRTEVCHTSRRPWLQHDPLCVFPSIVIEAAVHPWPPMLAIP